MCGKVQNMRQSLEVYLRPIRISSLAQVCWSSSHPPYQAACSPSSSHHPLIRILIRLHAHHHSVIRTIADMIAIFCYIFWCIFYAVTTWFVIMLAKGQPLFWFTLYHNTGDHWSVSLCNHLSDQTGILLHIGKDMVSHITGFNKQGHHSSFCILQPQVFAKTLGKGVQYCETVIWFFQLRKYLFVSI